MTDPGGSFEQLMLETLRSDLAAPPDTGMHLEVEHMLDYLLGALPQKEEALVRAHVARCSECRQQLAAIDDRVGAQAQELTGQAAAWSMSAFLHRRASAGRASARRWRWQPRFALGSAAIALFSAAAGIVRVFAPTSGPVPRGGAHPFRWDLAGLFFGAALFGILALLAYLRRRK